MTNSTAVEKSQAAHQRSLDSYLGLVQILMESKSWKSIVKHGFVVVASAVLAHASAVSHQMIIDREMEKQQRQQTRRQNMGSS